MPIEFPRPDLPSRAAATVFNDAKIAAVEWCSPKSFRLECGLAWLTERAFLGSSDQNFFWIGPDFAACNAAATLLKSALTPGCYSIPSRTLAFILINGATIWFRSADNPSTLYSDSCFAATIDKAVDIQEKSWRVIRETLANTRAPARIISTVAGRDNWFNELARRAEQETNARDLDLAEDISGEESGGEAVSNVLGASSPDLSYYRFTALDAVAEGILSSSDIDYARATLPDHVFRALYLAIPYDDRVEAAYKASDPKLMTDEELAIIANIDNLSSVSDEQLSTLAEGHEDSFATLTS